MSDKHHKTIYLNEYTPPPYLVTTVELRFELAESSTRVLNRMVFKRNPAVRQHDIPLELNGEKLGAPILFLDGAELDQERYTYDGRVLRIATVPDLFVLEVENFINPAAPLTIAEGIVQYCLEHNIDDVGALVGALDSKTGVSVLDSCKIFGEIRAFW